MGKALLSSYTSAGASAGTNFAYPGANCTPSSTPTEANKQVPFRAAGILTRLGILVDAGGTARSVTVRKGGVDQALTVTMTDTTAGLYLDTAHTVSVAAGDLINLKTILTGTPIIISSAVLNFKSSGNHATFFVASSITALTVASTTTFANIFGQLAGGFPTTEASSQHKHRAGASQVPAIFVIMPTNTRTTATTVTLRKNSVNGTNTISVGASGTGLFEDTAHTDTLANGDLINLAITTGTGAGSFQPAGFGCTIVATAGQVTNDCVGGTGVGLARAAGAPQTFQAIAGSTSATATEATSNIRHGFPVAVTNLRVNISANTYTGSCTVNLRKNGVDVTNTFAIGAAGTGFFEDTTHTDIYLEEDDCCVAFAGGTANSMTVVSIGVTERDLSYYGPPKTLVSISSERTKETQVSTKNLTPQVSTPPVTPNLGWLVNLSAERSRATVDLIRTWVPVYLPDNFYPRALIVSLQTAIPLRSILDTSFIQHVPTPFYPQSQFASIQTAILQTTWNVNLKNIQDAPVPPPVFNPIGWLVNLSTRVPIVSYNTASLPSMTPFTAPVLIGRIANQVSNVLGSRFSTMQGTKFPEQEPGAVLIGNGSWYPWIRRRRRS